jgi:GTP-binding protein EngB required for normal cell division
MMLAAAIHTGGENGLTATRLRGLLDQVSTDGVSLSARERQLLKLLQTYSQRLAAQRFQLAIVGQFKRGKSSLLNALLGADVLPTGILPLTSIPTFLASGDAFGLQVTFEGKPAEIFSPEDAHHLAGKLVEFVSEAANPKNAKQVTRVEVTCPSPLLADGLILIDTPGVGSTYRHNTEAAEAALPECDAALVVVSADPPITEVELAYLEKVRSRAVALIVVLNKTDTLDPGDLEQATGFLRSVLDSEGLASVDVVPVSARQGLAALRQGDTTGFAGSGIPALEQRIRAMLAGDRGRLLALAIARKTAPLVGQLTFENDLALAALTTPMERLQQQMEALDAAARGFAVERRSLADQLAGDRQRLLIQLDADAADMCTSVTSRLIGDLRARLSAGRAPQAVWDDLKARAPEIFDAELAATIAAQSDRLESILGEHRARAERLLDQVRRAAADRLSIPLSASSSRPAFEARKATAWVQRPRDTLSSVPASGLERLLPGAWGRRRAQARILEEVDQVVRANVEHLRWTTRQNIEESLRHFGADLDAALCGGLEGVWDSFAAAKRLREIGGNQAEPERLARQARAGDLQSIDRQIAEATT